MRKLEYASIALFALLAVAALGRLVDATGPWALAVVLVAAPLGWLASDLLSGMLHFALDSWGSVETPLVGKTFIRPFREHHADPAGMTRHDFVETHGASCFAALPALASAALLPMNTSWSIAIQATLLFVALGALATNQCHKWAHLEEAATPRLVRLAQRWRLVLPREHHGLHHTPPFDSHFCMSCGWFNPFFNFVLKRIR